MDVFFLWKTLFKMDDFVFFFLLFLVQHPSWNQDSGFLCKEVVDTAVFEGVADLKPGTPEFHQAGFWACGMDQIYSTEKQGWSGLKTTSVQTLVVFFFREFFLGPLTIGGNDGGKFSNLI